MRGRACLLMAAVWVALAVAGGHTAEKRKLVVAVIDQIHWHDLLDENVQLPTLRRLMAEGAVGMMCARTARSGEGGYLTLGCGSRAFARDSGMSPGPEALAFNVGERVDGGTAAERYRAYTGVGPGEAAILHLGIGELARQNGAAPYPVRLGLLGEELARAGLAAACVGNADTSAARHREIVTLAMDQRGLVMQGDVGAGLGRRSPLSPSGAATDEGRFLRAFGDAVKTADVLFVELGETARAAECAEHMTPQAAAEARKRALERSDGLLARALALMPEEGWAVMVVVPEVRPPDPGERMAALAPVILGGPEARPGALTSPSTRRPGLVVNTDVAATVLDFFGLPAPPDTFGRPMATLPLEGGTEQWLSAQVAREDDVESARRVVLRWLPIAGAAALWAAALLLLLGERAPRWTRVLVRGALSVILAVPAVALLAGAYPLPFPALCGVVVGGALLLAFVSGWVSLGRSAPTAASVVLALGLVYALLHGRGLLHWSPLSYSAVIGARFYGMGNEFGGALLGAMLVGTGGVLGSRSAGIGRRALAALALAGVAVLVGHTGMGANVGMALACAVGFGVFMLHLWRDEPGWREVLAVGVLFVGLVGVAVLAEVLFNKGEASHVGLLVAAVKARGWVPIWETISRKVAMNLLLVRHSIWADTAAAALTVLLVAVATRSTQVVGAMRDHQWLRPALTAGLFGAGAAFLLNDSGVVAAGAALLFAVGWLSYAALGDGKG